MIGHGSQCFTLTSMSGPDPIPDNNNTVKSYYANHFLKPL